jgi:predicted O-methyltransferase YrrM
MVGQRLEPVVRLAGVTIGGTATYHGATDLPPLVAAAAALAERTGFDLSCLPAHGRLLSVLAAGRPGGRIGETGTGCGVGLAWLATAADPSSTLVSIELDPARAAAARDLFAGQPNVTVLAGDWAQLEALGPFDLLALDGGGGGKSGEDPIEPRRWLALGGTVVLDDFTPRTAWPPPHPDGDVDRIRLHWLEHPDLVCTEVVTGPTSATLVATLR